MDSNRKFKFDDLKICHPINHISSDGKIITSSSFMTFDIQFNWKAGEVYASMVDDDGSILEGAKVVVDSCKDIYCGAAFIESDGFDKAFKSIARKIMRNFVKISTSVAMIDAIITSLNVHYGESALYFIDMYEEQALAASPEIGAENALWIKENIQELLIKYTNE